MPLGDPPATVLTVACTRCGLSAPVSVTADGQPAGLDPSFTPSALLDWFACARAAMASGTPGIAVGACPSCRAPLCLSSRQEVSLPCPHCAEPVRGTTADVLADQWLEPFAHVSGGIVDLEYRLVMLEDGRGHAAGCGACGAPSTPNAPDRCQACGAVAWVRRGPHRVQLAVRVDGTRDAKPFKALVPIVTGEGMLRADASRSQDARSGSSFLGVTGVGCASAVALLVFLSVIVGITVHFAHC